MRRKLAFVVALAASLTIANGARAQETLDVRAAADLEFKAGREAQAAGDFKSALTHLRLSQQLFPGRGKLLNIAICEEELGLLAAALVHFRDLAPQLADDPERRMIAEQHIAVLDPRVPRLRIEIAKGAPPGTRITLDDVRVAPGAPIPVDAGSHVVVVIAPRHLERRFDVSIQERASSTLSVSVGPVAAGAGPETGPLLVPEADFTTTPAPKPAPRSRTLAYAIGGVGLAGLAAGTVTGILALTTLSELNDSCPTPSTCKQDPTSLKDRGRTLSIVSTVSFGVGVAGVGVGAYLLWFRPQPAARSAQVGVARSF